MRLNKYIALASGMSRRAADEVIDGGHVTVDGEIAGVGTQAEDGQVVALDGKKLSLPEEHTYIMFNKPAGYVCSRLQQGDTETIYALLPEPMNTLKSVGRLDRDSSGLLVLTNDGTYAHQHLHPSFTKTKRYTVKLSKVLSDEHAALLQSGVELDDGMSRLQLKDVEGKSMTVILHEGRNRQIRRSFAALGYRVVQLHRTNFGSLKLGELQPGEYRPLSRAELAYA